MRDATDALTALLTEGADAPDELVRDWLTGLLVEGEQADSLASVQTIET